MSEPAPSPVTVYYDGACPLCVREIGFYRTRRGAEAIHWLDISEDKPGVLPPDLTREAALGRFHVRDQEGVLRDGADAFAVLWRALPGWAWLGHVVGWPPMLWLTERVYRAFLVVRPAMQRLAGAPPPACATPPLPRALLSDLRTDHAGETGAVWIYKGILAVTRDPDLRAFAERHQATETDHLHRLENILPEGDRSWLLGAWRVAGWLIGALPALFGPGAVYATIDTVETFVDRHYQEQIETLAASGEHAHIRTILEACQADEVHHRDEARAQAPASGWAVRLWQRIIAGGSAVAVAVSRRL